MFPPLLTQAVRDSISFAIPAKLTCSTFNYQEVRISISWAAQSWLTCSRSLFLPLSTLKKCVIHFIRGTTKADFFLPFSIIRMCVIFPPLSTLRQCVFLTDNQGVMTPLIYLSSRPTITAAQLAVRVRNVRACARVVAKPHARISARWKDAASIILEENIWTGMWGLNILMRNVRFFSSSLHLKRIYSPLRFYLVAHRCPYPDCGKNFSRHDNLMQHLRVHKDYVPFGSPSSSLSSS